MIWHLRDRRLLAPEGDDPGSGGSGTATPPAPPAAGDQPPQPAPPKEPSFSKKEVDDREAKLRRSYERKMKEQQAEMDARIKKLEGTPPPPPPPSPEDKTEEGRLKLLEERFSRTEQELNSKITEANERYEAELERRRKMERDHMLNDALTTAGVESKNMIAARRFFLPQIKWDKLDEGWMFQLSKGEHPVPIDEGIAAELPDIFKPSKLAKGGSGSQSGIPQSKQRRHRALEAEVTKLNEFAAQVKSRPHDHSAMSAYTQQKRKVQSLRAELGVSST